MVGALAGACYGLDAIPVSWRETLRGEWPPHSRQYLGQHELVKLAESMIAAEHFVPNEQGFYCGGGQYVDACKAWHREHARCIRFRLVA